MDILDIDEVLKDDSFCLMGDSGQDEVTNILQQWRQNGSSSSAGKFDTRTFTRPKRRSAQNLEPTFAIASKSNNGHYNSNVNLQIGGLVTSMQKSFLQDTSPPSSILSSMDTSIDDMANSLITSGDFTNVSFFNTAYVEDDVLPCAQIDGYNFDDMIKDRKALENLSLSGDSAIIKDCNIAQIDEITYLSKTNSGNSTMQNSTDSIPSGINGTFTMLNETIVLKNESPGEPPLRKESLNKLSKDNFNSVTQDDLICNTTISLIDSSHIQQPAVAGNDNINLTFDNDQLAANVAFLKTNKDILNKTFEKTSDLCPSTIMNRTYHRSMHEDEVNKTFDFSESLVENLEKITECFDSPVIDLQKNDQVIQSTPHRNFPVASIQTPSIKSIGKEVNISPIVPVKNEDLVHENRVADKTQTISNKTIDQLEKYLETLSKNFPNAEEQIEIFKQEKSNQDDSFTEMESFENGMEILTAENDEDEFDDMLEKLGKSSCINESIKMRQSLDNIKKKHSLANYEKSLDLTPKYGETNLEMSRILSDSMGKSSLSSSSSSERLLSRRSRLFDDMQVIKSSESPHLPTPVKDDTRNAFVKTDNPTLPISEKVESKTESSSSEAAENARDEASPTESRVRGERSRDPERFKTMRIFKKPTDDIVVPCIDGDAEHNLKEHAVPYVDNLRFSRRDQNSPTSSLVFNNNKSEVEPGNNMYQTYKKPKNLTKLPTTEDFENGIDRTIPETRSIVKPRSLSRPKQLSGLVKHDFSDNLPKANSASDIHRTANTTNGTRKPSNFSGTCDKSKKTLKSPMGTKAKSFNNLAGSYGFSSKLSISKPNSQPSLIQPLSGITSNREKTQQSDRTSILYRPTPKNQLPGGVEKNEKQVFKVPHPISNLRQPNSRRTGLMRPSSGFYSHTVIANEPEIETGRCSPSNSTSSGSSRGSAQDFQQKCTNGYANERSTSAEEEIQTFSDNVPAGQTAKALLTPKRSIPVPSKMRPPSSIRKSGLPQPSSIVRR